MVGIISYPILYNSTETDFNNNGIGILSSCVSCFVTEEANGLFELSMKYPIMGIHLESIKKRSIIKAKADQFREPQLFRVYAITKPMSGIVTVMAEHISYDLSGISVSPFSAGSVAESLFMLKSNATSDCPFDFWTDKDTTGKFSVPVPASIRSRLGGVRGSVLDVYGGEYEFDNYTVKLYNCRGANRGVSIRYGKNLIDLKQEENCSSVYTAIHPYWADVDGNVLELPEKIVPAPGSYDFVRIKTVDFSGRFEQKPTEEELRTEAQNYVERNEIGIPSVSIDLSFAQLEQSEEYKGLKILEHVGLFDTVNVEFPQLAVSTTAKAVKIVFNVLLDRVESASIGSVKANIAETIVNQQQEIQKKPEVTLVQQMITKLSDALSGAQGGAVRLLDTNGDGMPDELYIADNEDPEQAVRVWRFNYMGWAASKNGYNGPFIMGATLEDGLLAEFVTAARLVAGTIQSRDGDTFFLDLDNGILRMKAMDDISIVVQKIIDDGVDKVTTALGLTMTDSALVIHRPGSDLTNSIDETGMYVIRAKDTDIETTMLEANADGVNAENITVRKWFVAGDHLRIEKYNDGTDEKRVGFFYRNI